MFGTHLASSSLRPAVAIIYTGVSACFTFGTRAAAYCSKTTTCSLDSDGLLTNEDRPIGTQNISFILD